MAFKEIPIGSLTFNPFEKIGKEWFLVTAGDENGYNTMTASWGFMGVMWNKNTMTTVIRPSRYTYEFIEKAGLFTVSFLPEEKRPALNFCGSRSGRDFDKAAFLPTARQRLKTLSLYSYAGRFMQGIWIRITLPMT